MTKDNEDDYIPSYIEKQHFSRIKNLIVLGDEDTFDDFL
jgi:hypothetical protein